MGIVELKLEGDLVMYIDSEIQKWNEFPTSKIDELIRLSRKFENIEYSQHNVKKPVHFETNYNLGKTSVKSIQDDDGDITYTFYTPKEQQAQIDEDLAFDTDSKDKKFLNETEINHWNISNKIKKNVSKNNDIKRKVSSNISEDLNALKINGDSQVSKKIKVNQDIKQIEENNQNFHKNIKIIVQKRILGDSKMILCKRLRKNSVNIHGKVDLLRKKLKSVFLMNISDNKKVSGISRENQEPISFISKSKEFEKTKNWAVILKNIKKFERIDNKYSKFDSNFYLDEKPFDK